MSKTTRNLLLALIILIIGVKLLFNIGFSFISSYDISIINFSQIQQMENTVIMILAIITVLVFFIYLATRGEKKNSTKTKGV